MLRRVRWSRPRLAFINASVFSNSGEVAELDQAGLEGVVLRKLGQGRIQDQEGERHSSTTAPGPVNGSRNPCQADASNPVTRQVLFATEEASAECTTRLATSPRLLRRVARRWANSPATPGCSPSASSTSAS